MEDISEKLDTEFQKYAQKIVEGIDEFNVSIEYYSNCLFCQQMEAC